MFEEIFCSPPPIEHFNKLSKENQKYAEYLMDIGQRITFLSQDVQDGFGHAVHCAKSWVGNEPFLLMLGDHLYASDTDIACSCQLLDAYEKTGQSVVGLKPTPASDIHHFGCATGAWEKEGELISITEFAEKPDPEYAKQHLCLDGIPDDSYLTVFGQYILSPKIFEYLDDNIRLNMREKGEFQLTSCLDRLRKEHGMMGLLIKGQRFDVGNAATYVESLVEFKKADGRNRKV